MAAIHALSQRYGFRIIEDASHAIGGHYKGEPVGCCRYSDIAVFSFHPVKIITTGEGGMAVTNDEVLARCMERLRSHGVTRDPDEMTCASEGPWFYQQLELGFNYRMTDVQAALGLSQLQRLDEYVRKRNELAELYDEALRDLPVVTPWQHPDVLSARHLYVIRLRCDGITTSRGQVFEGLRAEGIGVNLHYIPVHTQPYYQALGFREGDFPEAERYYDEAISLPLFPNMSEVMQDRVILAVEEALS
jgi:dTDP-4-amino-4,6-dideoxygalactose transaminase